jgi:DNA-binding GntR family transcriptional regulator
VTGLPEVVRRADAIAARLRRAIVSGEYEAGTRLRQADVAERFGVSTTPVREAFVSLVRQGFLSGDPHKGVMVRQPDVAEMHELYEIRFALEPLATAMAAKRITDQDLADLDVIVEEMRALAAQESAEDQHNVLNANFHARIYSVADRPRLFELIMGLRAQSGVYVRMFPVEIVARGVSDEQHAGIVEALRSRSPRRAERAMREHLRFNVEHIAKQLPPPRDRRA